MFEIFLLFTLENKYVSSTKTSHIDVIPSGKSLTYIKNKKGPQTESCWASARILRSCRLEKPFVDN